MKPLVLCQCDEWMMFVSKNVAKNLNVISNNTLMCLQAFVKMVGANVNAMEEQVTQAEGELGTLPGAFKKILRTMSVPGFLNVRAP